MLAGLLSHLDEQRDHLFLWLPVCLAIGAGTYFGLPLEPSALSLACLGVLVLFLVTCRRWLPDVLGYAALGVALVALGYCIAAVRAHSVSDPVLSFRYYGPIEGRIVMIDRSQSDAVRLTLDHVVLSRMSPERTPARVRISLHSETGLVAPEPGQLVLTTGHLSPPSGPVEPGGFDFQRMAWFQGLGAVGYTRNPVVLGAEASEGAAGLWIYRLRVSISGAVQDIMGPETGPMAAAILTGDRSGMDQDSLTALRASNLAHLLAISGMHMGILASFVFAVVRYGLALWPRAALRLPVKKVAAIVALLAASAYLALSGGNVATQRAFVMVSVMLVAVLFDRRALTLRAVAIAAVIILILRPEALYGPGFQMSFAATTALVAVFSALRHVDLPRMPNVVKAALSVFVSSLVAGLATAPIAAFHFNQVAQFGLIANLLSVPLMGTLVMPAAVLAAVLAPLGLAAVGLWVMDLGLRWILGVAHVVADMPYALRHVVTPDLTVLLLIAFGGLFVILWRGRVRIAGLAPLALGFALWHGADRPALLVAQSGSLIGVMGPDGRDVSKERGESFAAGSWLENDGAPVAQSMAYARQGLREDGRTVFAVVGGQGVLNIRGATALAKVQGCGGAQILITNQEMEPLPGCEVYDITRLRASGALAGWVRDGQLEIVSARDVTGDRLWNTRPENRAEPALSGLAFWRQ